MKKVKSTILLFMTALIWGAAFVAQSEGMKSVGPFTFNGIRSFIGGIVLVPCIFVLRALGAGENKKSDPKRLAVGGIVCGVFLFAASSLQQIGLVSAPPGKAGFVTAMYIVLVPLVGCFVGRKPGARVFVSALVAVVGLYFLCFTGGSEPFEWNDLFLIGSALLFTGHILAVDRYAPDVDGVKLSCIQFFVCGILSVVPMFMWENPDPAAIMSAKIPILYAGVMSCGVAYTLQIIGQKGADPSVASLILSLESVFALLCEFVFNLITGAPNTITPRIVIGAALMFAAIVLSQLPSRAAQQKVLTDNSRG